MVSRNINQSHLNVSFYAHVPSCASKCKLVGEFQTRTVLVCLWQRWKRLFCCKPEGTCSQMGRIKKPMKAPRVQVYKTLLTRSFWVHIKSMWTYGWQWLMLKDLGRKVTFPNRWCLQSEMLRINSTKNENSFFTHPHVIPNHLINKETIQKMYTCLFFTWNTMNDAFKKEIKIP